MYLSRNSFPIPRRDGCCPKSADTAVVIREYGPTTNIPHPISSAMFPPTQFTPGSSGQSALNSLYPKSYFKITLILSYSNIYITRFPAMLDSLRRNNLFILFSPVATMLEAWLCTQMHWRPSDRQQVLQRCHLLYFQYQNMLKFGQLPRHLRWPLHKND